MSVFLAMLKDSFREALDSKVLYVLLAFSLLFSLFCLSIGFRDRPYGQAVKRVFSELEWGNASLPKKNAESPNLTHPDCESVEEGADGLLTVRLRVSGEDEFLAHVLAPGTEVPKNLDDLAKQSDAKIITIEGRRGFEYYLMIRLGMSGFSPENIRRSKDGEWKVTVRPIGKFRTEGAQSVSLLFGATEIDLASTSGRDLIFQIQSTLADTIGGWVGMLIAIVVTAWFLPGMLQKGSIDLLLARPVPRWQILVFKYIGGLVFVFLNASVLIGGTWLGMTLATGFVHGGYLLSVFTLTLLFAIVYSVSILASVLFQNVVLSIVLPVGFWFACSLINKWALFIDSPLGDTFFQLPDWAKTLTKIAYYVFPATTDIGNLNTYFMILGKEDTGRILQMRLALGNIDFTGSIISSLVFTALVLAFSAWWFHRKEF